MRLRIFISALRLSIYQGHHIDMNRSAVFALVVSIPFSVAAQPSFEVASVKPNTSADFRGSKIDFQPGGRFIATNYPLQLIISVAWGVPFNRSPRLSGGPDWIRSDRYDIEAKAGAGSIPPGLSAADQKARMRQMLRTLLIDRFQLSMSSETKELPVFFVVAGKGGPKLEKAKIEEKDCGQPGVEVACHVFMGGQGRGLHGQAVDMADLASYVENWAERPVIDKTGIKGLFHIETRGWMAMTPGPPPAAGVKSEDGSDMADLPTLFGVFDGLGLKLEAQKAPVEVFHIDKIEKPAQN